MRSDILYQQQACYVVYVLGMYLLWDFFPRRISLSNRNITFLASDWRQITTWLRFCFSYRSTVWNNSVVGTPYCVAASKNMLIDSIFLNASFCGLSPFAGVFPPIELINLQYIEDFKWIMSTHVLSNLLNKLGKRDTMRVLSSISSLFRNEYNKFKKKEYEC